MLHSNWQPGQAGHAAEHNEIAQRLVSIKDFGGVGDNATDNAVAIAAGIAHAINNNSRLYFPKGKYKTSVMPDLSNLNTVELAGDGSEDRPDSAIIYTGTAPIALNMQGSRGCRLNGIAIAYSNPASTGHLIHAGGGSAYPSFINCWIGAMQSATNSASALVCIDGSYGVTFRKTQFLGGQFGLVGKLINDINGKSGYANHVTLDQFSHSAVAPSNAAFLLLTIDWFAIGAGEVCYMDCFSVALGTSKIWTLPDSAASINLDMNIRPVITGSRSSGTAIQSLLSQLSAIGLITDVSTP